jgi:uncharacterized lipoprotein YajG
MTKSTILLLAGVVLMAGCTTERQSNKNEKAFTPGYCQPFQLNLKTVALDAA